MTYIYKNEIKLFREGDETMMEKVYLEAKPLFIGYFKKEHALGLGEAEDLYQDSFCTLHKKVFSGQINGLTSKWESLLIGIGKNNLRNQKRKKAEILSDSISSDAEAMTPLDLIEKKEEMIKVNSLMGLVGDLCKKILFHFYYEEKSMQEIADAMNYANANVAKKNKSVCLKKLREKVKANGIGE